MSCRAMTIASAAGVLATAGLALANPAQIISPENAHKITDVRPAPVADANGPQKLRQFEGFVPVDVSSTPGVRGTPPANDLCSGAIALPASPFSTDTTTATNDLFAVGAPLNPFVGTIQARNVWYTFTPTITGVLRISTCASDFTSYFQAYNFCPSGANEAFFCSIANDCGPFPFQTDGDIPVTIGQPILISFGGYNWTQQGATGATDFEFGILNVEWQEIGSVPPICVTAGDNNSCQLAGPGFYAERTAYNSTVGGIVRADDFNIFTFDSNPGLVNNICFYGTYFDDLNPPADDFLINIYANPGNGNIGAPVAQLSAVDFTLTRQNSGNLVAGAILYEYNVALNSPVALPEGCYFLEIANDVLGQGQVWFWANAADAANASLNPNGNRYSLSTAAGAGGIPGAYVINDDGMGNLSGCDYRLFEDLSWCISGTNFLLDSSLTCRPTFANLPDCIPCDFAVGTPVQESEACAERINDGCLLPTPAFETATANTQVCGIVELNTVTGIAGQDQDWYVLTTTGPVELDLTLLANFNANLFLFVAPLGVGGTDCSVPASQTGFSFTSPINGTLILPTFIIPGAGDWVWLVRQNPGRAFLMDCTDAFDDDTYLLTIGVTDVAGTGACCIDLGGGVFQCLEGVTEDDCEIGNGGVYQGDDVLCTDINDCQPVVTPCPCDRDGDGFQTVSDYFAYLTEFFAQLGGPGSADLDGDGTVTVGDFFVFLNCLPAISISAPCP